MQQTILRISSLYKVVVTRINLVCRSSTGVVPYSWIILSRCQLMCIYDAVVFISFGAQFTSVGIQQTHIRCLVA